MAFEIKKLRGASVEQVSTAIRLALTDSRFTADVETPKNKVAIRNVRLKQSKDYCGNHPNACPIRPNQPHRPHKHQKFLEGADWVGFNDMLNDILDNMGVEANVASSLCIIRKGRNRRAEYHGHFLGNGIDREWDKDSSFYADRIGKKNKVSTYPKDTPGFASYKIASDVPEADESFNP